MLRMLRRLLGNGVQKDEENESEEYITATVCGHTTCMVEKRQVCGEEVEISPLKTKQGDVHFCIDCVERMIIPCAWCERFIFPADPITLYTPRYPEHWRFPEDAVIYNREPLQLVGCGRTDCADTGADYAGFWEPDEDGSGRCSVRRVPSLIEQAMQSGEAVVNDDLLNEKGKDSDPER